MLDKIDLSFEPRGDEVNILCCGDVMILGIAEVVGSMVVMISGIGEDVGFMVVMISGIAEVVGSMVVMILGIAEDVGFMVVMPVEAVHIMIILN
jgi:hypothetical protein